MLPHKYELTTVVRQDPNEIELLTCLSELRLGKCGKNNERFISEGLSKDLDEHLKKNAIHIFFKKTSVMFFNIKMMQALPETFLRFDAIDEGNTTNIRCMAKQVLMLKPRSLQSYADMEHFRPTYEWIIWNIPERK